MIWPTGFFATARWSADQLGLVLLDLIAAMLVPAGTPLLLATDDTLWRRSGPRLHGAAWHHDGVGPGRHRPAWGHRWVVVGVIVHLPFLTRAVCLPILARELVDLATGHFGDRPVQLVGDAAYIGKPLRGLPTQVTVTVASRLWWKCGRTRVPDQGMLGGRRDSLVDHLLLEL